MKVYVISLIDVFNQVGTHSGVLPKSYRSLDAAKNAAEVHAAAAWDNNFDPNNSPRGARDLGLQWELRDGNWVGETDLNDTIATEAAYTIIATELED